MKDNSRPIYLLVAKYELLEIIMPECESVHKFVCEVSASKGLYVYVQTS